MTLEDDAAALQPAAGEVDFTNNGELSSAQPNQAKPAAVPFWEALRFWWVLGCISFGGPAGQIAIMHKELVERKRWISERRFMHALNFCMVLPGPEAQQLATYIGWLLHGVLGGIVAGGLFVLPSLLLLLVLSAAYAAYGSQPAAMAVLQGVKPAVVAIVVFALVRIGSRALTNWFLVFLALASFAAMGLLGAPFPLIVLTAAVISYITSKIKPAWVTQGKSSHHGGQGQGKSEHSAPMAYVIDDDDPPPPHAQLNRARIAAVALTGLFLWGAPIALTAMIVDGRQTMLRMAWFFTTAALVTFGGAYAVLPFVAQQSVEHYKWLTATQMMDGLALGETTPGPLIMVVSFVGFIGGYQTAGMGWLGGIAGCLVATYFTFLPSFVFIFLGGPFIERLRGEVNVASVLTGITAAIVGAILSLAVYFARVVFFPHPLIASVAPGSPDQDIFLQFTQSVKNAIATADLFAILLAAAAFYALKFRKTPTSWVVLACIFVGLGRYLLWTQP